MVLEELEDFIYSLVYAIWYPFDLIIQMILSWLDQILDPFEQLLDLLYTLITTIYDFISSFFNYFPTTWGYIVSLIIVVKFAKLLFSYLEGVEILGFKI